MDKKQILVLYPFMMVGGSTTALINFLRNLNQQVYGIDLQLYKNVGPLLKNIPAGVRLLPPAIKYDDSIMGRIRKMVLGIFSGYLVLAYLVNKRNGKSGPSHQILAKFQAMILARSSKGKHYDYCVSFLEGTGQWYMAYRVHADYKYAWIHSSVDNVYPLLAIELPWMRRVDKIIFVSNACKQDFCKKQPDLQSKAITVENIVDAEFIRMRSEEDLSHCVLQHLHNSNVLKIATLTRIDIQIKGLDRIVACALKLRQRNVDFLWCVIGDGAEMSVFKQMIEDNDLQNHILLTGMQNNPYPFVAACDILCHPSRWEGKPIAVTEGKILGLPIVATNFLSAKSQILDGKEGFVVDNPDNIAECIVNLFDDKPLMHHIQEYLLAHSYDNRPYCREIEKKLFSR